MKVALEEGYDIRTVQEWLDYRDASTTMIHAYVLGADEESVARLVDYRVAEMGCQLLGR